MVKISFLLLAAFVVIPTLLVAQNGKGPVRDTIPEFSIQTVVVTADRFENPIANTTSSVSALTANDFHALPVTRFSDAAQYLPGFFVVDKDGAGRDAVITTPGFYGGGHAQYMLSP